MAKTVERVNLNRRRFLQLSGASLAAGGLHIALKRPALAQVPDPASEEPDLLVIDGLTEAANDPDVQQYIRTGASPLWVAGMFMNVWIRNLDFMTVPQDLVRYYRTAGVTYRDLAGAQSIWETIPREVRMAGPRALREFKSGRDWSHFIPRSLGGGDSASEGIFEDSALNKARGAKKMKPEEIEVARKALRTAALKTTIRSTATVAVTGALAGAVVSGVFAVMEYGLQYHEGKLTRAKLYEQVWTQVGKESAIAIAISGVIAGLAILFPPLLAVLSAIVLPLAFVSFAFVGYQFYAASKSWREAGFDPLLGAWDTSKVLTSEAWERSAALFEKFQDAAEQAWVETKETAQEAWDRTKTGADSVLQRGINWLRSKVSSGDICDYSLVEIDDYSVAEIYEYAPAEICD